MDNVVIQRVIKIKEQRSKSESEFALLIGSKQKTLNQQLRGERNISIDTILNILSSFEDISAEWLLRGDGDMIKSSEPQHLDEHDELIKLRAENNLLRDIVGLKELQNKNAG